MYNLFHPHDPVAYRIEPLLIETYGEAAEGGEGGEGDEGRETEGEAEGEAAQGEEGSDPWLVEAGERARQLIEEEDDWATEAQVSRCALGTAVVRTPYLLRAPASLPRCL